jgi:hypothetical protein
MLIVSDREAFAWIVESKKMAVARSRVKSVSGLGPGARVFVYTTRGCFRNPTRDLGAIVALGTVTSDPRNLERPVEFDERSFEVGFDLNLEGLANHGDGVPISKHVEQLELFPDPQSWSARMRRTVVPLGAHDTALLEKLLMPRLLPISVAFTSYESRIWPGGKR